MALPTSAQWEYACRAGTSTPWSCAKDELAECENLADATGKRFAPAWGCEEWDDGHSIHAPVGSFRPNAFGLFDVHGNVKEWARDGLFAAGTVARDGDGLRGEPAGRGRLWRGGSFTLMARFARSGVFLHTAPSTRHGDVGVRAARMLVR
jgi:formylglycine-generating enzyme required for sulfatase activity